MADLIDRQAAIDALYGLTAYKNQIPLFSAVFNIEKLPSAQPEQLTDKEQRIFLSAMGRELEICKEVDEKYPIEPYEETLVRVCREIERKVKKALWTN